MSFDVLCRAENRGRSMQTICIRMVRRRSGNSLLLGAGSRKLRLSLNDVMRVESIRHTIIIHALDGKLSSSSNTPAVTRYGTSELMTATTSAMLICNMVVSSLFVVHVSTVSMLLPRLTPMCRPSSGAVQHALMPLHQKICPVVPLRPILSFRVHNLHASRA
ncbi:hypothetical protein BPORC_2057 [Bifidobacterium porcinum]|nr:hypothetical protein BPORC_2057 [Bifidobacterium porcinum]